MSVEGLKAAMDKTKQIVTLSTGVVTLSITFYDKIGSEYNRSINVDHVPLSLKIAWILFGVTIVFGVWTMGAITGVLDYIDRKSNDEATKTNDGIEINGAGTTSIKVPAVLMGFTFLLAMGFSIVGAVMVGW